MSSMPADGLPTAAPLGGLSAYHAITLTDNRLSIFDALTSQALSHFGHGPLLFTDFSVVKCPSDSASDTEFFLASAFVELHA